MALPLTCVTVLLLAQAVPDRPSDVTWQAMRAVERDSVPAFRSSWERELARDPTNRRAMLGLATLDRLLYDTAARGRYLRLLNNPPPDDPYTPYAWIGLGWLDLWRVGFDSSRIIFGHGLRSATTTGDSVARAEATLLMGWLDSRLIGPGAGAALIESSLAMLPRDQRALESAIRCVLAPVLSFAGRPEALAEARKGLALAQQAGQRRMEASCYFSIANVMIATSADVAHANLLLDSAVTGHREAGDRAALAITLFTKGYNRLGTFDLAAAKRDLLAALVEARAAGSDFAEAWSHRMLSRLHWQTGNLPAAEQEFRQAGVLFERLNDGLALGGMQLGLSVAAIAQGRLDEAEERLRRRLVITQQIGQAEGEIDIRGFLASIEAARGNWSAARQGYLETARFAAAHGHRAWLPYYRYISAVAALRMGDLALAERELRDYLASPEIDPSGRYAARSRLAEVLVRRGDIEASLREITGATDELDSLRNQLDDYQLKLLVFQTRDDRDEPDLGLATIVAGLVKGGRPAEAFRLSERRRARTLADRLLQADVLREDSSSGSRSRPAGNPLPSDLAAAVPDDRTAVIEFLAGRKGQPTTAFVLTGSGVRGVILPSMDSIEPVIVRYLRDIRDGRSTRESGLGLRRRLLDSLLQPLPQRVTRLLIVPDDLLHRLPLDALPMDDGQPLLRRYAVAVVPSAAIATHLYARREVRPEPRILAVGDPRFPGEATADPAGETYRSAFLETGGLPRLAASAREARRAARFSRHPELRLRDDASEAFLKRSDLAGFHVIHLASHALVDERTLERTALALAPGGGEDGFVSAGDLSALKLNADLVVLSACRTASGVVVGGEGVQGLVAPLISAGARSVVATMWPVGDRSTARFIEDFYRQLAEGRDVSEAIRQAKIAAIDRGAPLAEWAAFNVIGDPLVQIRLSPPSPKWLWFAVAVALAIATALLLSVRLRRQT
jgi:CHAT domain-containing protein/tetratricopeptide (TPR) repeat protein